jgi:hypothetical protein
MADFRFMSYSDVQKWFQQHPLRQTEIPIEHAVSLPLPTLRWGEPAFAFFAAPAERLAGGPSRQGAPDRWWAFRAKGGQVLVYALTHVVAFGPGDWQPETVLPAADNVVALRRMVLDIEQMMDVLVPEFFAGNPGDSEVRQALAGVFSRFVSSPLMDRYHALAPDFFTWLEANASARR